jgi:hypothetical protein
MEKSFCAADRRAKGKVDIIGSDEIVDEIFSHLSRFQLCNRTIRDSLELERTICMYLFFSIFLL